MTKKEKVLWFEGLEAVLELGFDVDKNSARDLLNTVNGYLDLREKGEI